MSQATLPQEGPLPLTTGSTPWVEDGYYSFLAPEDDKRISRETDPVRVMLDIRSGLADLPATAATFTLKEILDEHEPRSVAREMMALCGSWEVPDIVPNSGSNSINHWVNPAYENVHHYSDAIVRCECGNAFIRPEAVGGETKIEGGHEHTDDCKPQYRLHARGRLAEKREQIIVTMGLLYKDGSDICPRLGLSKNSMTELANSFNIDTVAMRERGRELMAETIARLLPQYDAYTLGAVFDYSRDTITRYTKEYTDCDVAALTMKRREETTRPAWRSANGGAYRQ